MWLLRNWFAMAWWRGGRGRRMGGQVYRARGRSYEEREYEHGKGKLSSFFAVAWSVQSFSLIYRGNQSPTWMTPIERSLLHTSLLSFKFRKVMSRLPVRPIRFVPLGTARFWESLGLRRLNGELKPFLCELRRSCGIRQGFTPTEIFQKSSSTRRT